MGNTYTDRIDSSYTYQYCGSASKELLQDIESVLYRLPSNLDIDSIWLEVVNLLGQIGYTQPGLAIQDFTFFRGL